MRTLLNESLPPHFNNEPAYSPPETIRPSLRTFSENTVLSTNEASLMEVGVDGTVIATPDAGADLANTVPERGLTTSGADGGQLKESPAL
jgi:hypothetical protein